MRQTHLHDDPAEIVPLLATGYTRGGDGALRLARLPGGVVATPGCSRPPAICCAGNATSSPRSSATPRCSRRWRRCRRCRPGSRPRSPSACRSSNTAGGGRWATPAGIRAPPPTWSGIRSTILSSPSSATSTRSVTRAGAQRRRHLPGRKRRAARRGEPAKVTIPATALAANEGLYRAPGDESLLRISSATACSTAARGRRRRRLAGDAARRRSLRHPGHADRAGVRPGRGRGADAADRRRAADAGRPGARGVLHASRGGPGGAGRRLSQRRAVHHLHAAPERGHADRRRAGPGVDRLQPIRPDLFAGSLLGAITIARDRTGRPTGFTVHAHAARGVRFDRLPPAAPR